MKIIAYDIDYDITDEDIESQLSAYLEVADLNNYTGDIATTDLDYIAIDKSIIDDYFYGQQLLIGFADAEDRMAFMYRFDDEDDDSIFAKKVETYTYDELINDALELLTGESIELDVTEEEIAGMSDEELDEYIGELISDSTDYLLTGFSYEIIRE